MNQKAEQASKQPQSPANSRQTPPDEADIPRKVSVKERVATVDPAKEAGLDWHTFTVGAAVSLAAFVLYVLTAARDVISGDTPDFLIAAKTLGVAHASGYPLLTLLGHLFSWLPVGSIPFRIGLVAVVSSTATVALVYATVWRLTSLRAPAAAAGLALACTPLFWRWSLQIETFPLNNVLVALTVYLLVCWYRHPAQRKYLVVAAFAFGLGVTNQETTVLLTPAILWLLWLHRQQLNRDRRTIGYAALALVAGALPYVYVPFAALGHSPDNWDYVHSFSAFMRLVLRKDFGGFAGQGAAPAPGGNVAIRVLYLARGFGIVVGIFSLVGIVDAYRKMRWYFWFVVLAVTISGIWLMIVSNLNPTNSADLFVLERFFLIPLVIAAPLVGLGVGYIGRIITDRQSSFDLHQATDWVAVIVVVASLVIVGLNYSALNVSNDHVAGNYARDALQELKPRTILFENDESDFTDLYMTTVARVRPDVTVLISGLLAAPWYAQILRHNNQINVPTKVTTLNIIRANPDRPVAFIGPAPDNSIDGKYYLYPDGLVSRLERVGRPIIVTEDESDNEALLKRVHIPNYQVIKPDSNEPAILDNYAAIPYHIGQAYSLAGQTTEAIVWYRRALAMDPTFTLASRAILKLGGAP